MEQVVQTHGRRLTRIAPAPRVNPLYPPVKRLIDIIGSFCALILFLPFFLVLAILVKRDSDGPILYRQARVGRHKKYFKMLKFRTMTVCETSDGNDGITSPSKQPRITKSGHFMRKYRFDELPQLWNVLVGDMSLVGPRPQTPRYVDIYGEVYDRICTVRPGMTGLATIKFHEIEERMIIDAGDNADQVYIDRILPMKFRYNLFYIRNRGLWFDIKILWWTVIGLIRK